MEFKEKNLNSECEEEQKFKKGDIVIRPTDGQFFEVTGVNQDNTKLILKDHWGKESYINAEDVEIRTKVLEVGDGIYVNNINFSHEPGKIVKIDFEKKCADVETSKGFVIKSINLNDLDLQTDFLLHNIINNSSKFSKEMKKPAKSEASKETADKEEILAA